MKNKNLFMMIALFLFLMPLVWAEVETLGNVKQYDCIKSTFVKYH